MASLSREKLSLTQPKTSSPFTPLLRQLGLWSSRRNGGVVASMGIVVLLFKSITKNSNHSSLCRNKLVNKKGGDAPRITGSTVPPLTPATIRTRRIVAQPLTKEKK